MFVLIEFMISKLDMVEISSNIYFKINFKCSAQKLELKRTLIQDGCQYYEKKFQIANKKKQLKFGSQIEHLQTPENL